MKNLIYYFCISIGCIQVSVSDVEDVYIRYARSLVSCERVNSPYKEGANNDLESILFSSSNKINIRGSLARNLDFEVEHTSSEGFIDARDQNFNVAFRRLFSVDITPRISLKWVINRINTQLSFSTYASSIYYELTDSIKDKYDVAYNNITSTKVGLDLYLKFIKQNLTFRAGVYTKSFKNKYNKIVLIKPKTESGSFKNFFKNIRLDLNDFEPSVIKNIPVKDINLTEFLWGIGSVEFNLHKYKMCNIFIATSLESNFETPSVKNCFYIISKISFDLGIEICA